MAVGIIRRRPSPTPGMSPPRKSFPTETPPPAAMAKMIMLWLGGIRTPATEKSAS